MAGVKTEGIDHVAVKFPDLKANALALDCFGRLVVLAGRQYIAVLDINKPSEISRRIWRGNKREISIVQWNPHVSHADYFIISSNDQAELWMWNCSKLNAPITSFKAHARTITDLDWSKFDANILATSSVDTFTHLWDMRDTKKPYLTFQSVVSPCHVKWNKFSSNLLATAHEGDIRVWDCRKNTSAVYYITGHQHRISDIDWSPFNGTQIVSCSHDCSVKIWDTNHTSHPLAKIRSTDPVVKAKYTPFGNGVVTVAMSHLRHVENSMYVWSLNSNVDAYKPNGIENNKLSAGRRQSQFHQQEQKQPVHSFIGHTDGVFDIYWRHTEAAGYELISWSRDQTLRLWNAEPAINKLCGEMRFSADSLPSTTPTITGSYSSSNESTRILSTSLNNDVLHAASLNSVGQPIKQVNNPTSQLYPHTLLHEFALLNFDIPNVFIHKMDAVSRTCHVTAVCGSFEVHLSMHFPDAYPNSAEPSFILNSETTLDNSQQCRLTKVLHNTALQHVKHNRSCIEPCLRQLIVCLAALQDESQRSTPDTPPEADSSRKSSISQHVPSFLSQHSIEYLRRMSVPFPRTSGARFCGAGYLVCFTRRIVETIPRVGSDLTRGTPAAVDLLPTPRAMSALSELSQATPLIPLPGHSYNYNYSSSLMGRSLPLDSTLPSISEYYNYKDQVRPQQPKQGKTKVKTTRSTCEMPTESETKDNDRNNHLVTGPVVIYDIFCILPVSRQLAQDYVFDKDFKQMCKQNAVIAGSIGRTDLQKTWTLVSMCKEHMAACQSYADSVRWSDQAFGRQLVESLFLHYSALHDVQTLAMISCVLATKHQAVESQAPLKSSSSVLPPSSASQTTSSILANDNMPLNYKTYHTIHPSDTTLKGWNYTVSKLRRSNSWSEAFEDFTSNVESTSLSELNKETTFTVSESLSDPMFSQRELYKKVYANMLFQFGLNNQRAQVLKYVSTPRPQQHVGLDVAVLCKSCNKRTNTSMAAQCSSCRKTTMTCVVCRMSVRGLCSVCMVCYHGGHTSHMNDWFAGHTECPAGCGCQCLYQQRSNPVDHTVT